MLRLPPPPDPRGARAYAGIAEEFENGRPGYAAAAVHWLVREPRAHVLEVGAGTGKLTREMVAAGHDVMALEPVPEMLDQLRLAVPAAHPTLARAEALPVVSRSVDVVVAADSFQWFDAPVFLSEATRVLRPGGVLALLWNEPDVRVPWVRRLAALIGADHLLAEPDETALPHRAVDDTGQFESVEHGAFRVWHRLRKSQLRDLVACRPDVVARGPVALERLLEDVDALFDDVSTSSELAMPLTTHCFRAVVLPWAYVGAPRRTGRAAAAVDAVPPTPQAPPSSTEGAGPDVDTAPVVRVDPTGGDPTGAVDQPGTGAPPVGDEDLPPA